MAFKKGKSGNEKTAFEKGKSGNENGRPRKLVSTILADLKTKGEIVSKSMVADAFQVLMSLTQKELTDIANDNDAAILMRITARELLGKKGFEAVAALLDRAHGKAMITQEIKQENTGDTIKVIFESTGVKLPQSENDFIDD
jgi:hypothetical protein